MSRLIFLNLLASALTILATIGFLGATAMGTSTPVAVSGDANTRLVAYAFYDAVNAMLRTGDSGELDRIVAPHFILHGASPSASPDRAALIRQLVATSAVAPALHLEIAEIAVAGDRAIIHLSTASGAPATLFGVPFNSPPPVWAPFNVLGIADGQIVEFWSGDESLPQFELLRQARLDPLLTDDHAVRLRRLRTDAAQAWSSASTFVSRVLYVEAGALTVDVDPSSPRPAVIFAGGEGRGQERTVRPGERAVVGEGEALALSPLALYELRAEADQPDLRAYELAFPRFIGTTPEFPGMVGPPPSARPAWESLAEAANANLPREALRVTFGRVILPPGRTLALGAAPGPMVLSVESGTLGLEARPVDGAPLTATVEPGSATLLPHDALSTLRAVGAEPVIVVVITTLPVHAGASTMPRSSPARTDP